MPTSSPTKTPTGGPTPSPTTSPSVTPSKAPTGGPTPAPSVSPSESPSSPPTEWPTDSPSAGPSSVPTAWPTDAPSASPTSGPASDRSGPTPTDSWRQFKKTPAPTGTPTASAAPTVCEDGVIAVTEHSYDSSLGSTADNIPITVVSIEKESTVTFTVDQSFYNGEVPVLAILHFTDSSYACETRAPASPYSDGDTKVQYTASCRGSETTTVAVYVGDTADGSVLSSEDDATAHIACRAALAQANSQAASQLGEWFYDVPCTDPCSDDGNFNPAPPKEFEPTASPTGEKNCVEVEPQAVWQSCEYETLVEHVTGNSTHAVFNIIQTFTESSVEWMAVYYSEYGEDSCSKVLSPVNTGSAVEQITAD
ncbi:AvrBs3 and PthA family of transcription activator-like effector proteins [Seminavis robusta]|uniref:AvrBs3 and PthA family of transcription activator-like effector proteins n=1 Tax=Seminavis robusta TaxID=568900 RepID=A0A9N8DBE0_9STRA|nr:AvrBs3 and PthA family of transcription activator-like effector proteins [Seminavis robusta]|eukprot:Sro44_g026640.1 AvrBs3 and PthA family of transcription activator-like effector proteins (366) ;mRNA; r:79195-80491